MTITLSIDLALIPKERIKSVTKKDGTVGKYLDVVVFTKDQEDKFGNTASIQVSLTKEEREDKAAPIYLGNGKVHGVAPVAPLKPVAPVAPTKNTFITEDDLPF